MEKVFEWLKMDDGAEIFTRFWLKEKPKAIVQIAHGMAEHIERYHDFAKFLNAKGISAAGNDHRGHGHTGERAGLFGYFADKDGFERAADDLYIINRFLHQRFPDTPIFLLGHSMGSFLARRYVQKYHETVTGAIFSGTGEDPGIAGKIGKFLAKREMKRNGAKNPSPAMDKLIFGSYNKGIDEVENKFTWLSRDKDVVEEYVKDPYCGFVCTSGFFYDLLSGLQEIHKDENIQRIPKDLPILIFSGDKDPVGAHSIGVKRVIHQYEKNGLTNVKSILYPGGRHEMLNEINKDEVYEDVYRWITAVLENRGNKY